jgi:hypothetical protein
VERVVTFNKNPARYTHSQNNATRSDTNAPSAKKKAYHTQLAMGAAFYQQDQHFMDFRGILLKSNNAVHTRLN